MNCIKLLPLAFLFSSLGCLAIEEKFGIVTLQNGFLCASFGEKPPQVGSFITILETQSLQYFFEGKLGDENEGCKFLENSNIAGPYFIVTTAKQIAEPFIGVAVLSKSSVSLVNDEVVLNSAMFKEGIYFRSCASGEGLHFSSWLGQPLSGERIWHLYYYLGYDVEPDCHENDFKK